MDYYDDLRQALLEQGEFAKIFVDILPSREVVNSFIHLFKPQLLKFVQDHDVSVERLGAVIGYMGKLVLVEMNIIGK
jgi:hypothetical protein